jgi:hypothetical protein
MEQIGAVVGASVVMPGRQLCVLLEGLQLVLPFFLQLIRDPLQFQNDRQRLAVDEFLVPELLWSVLERPDRQQDLPVRQSGLQQYMM